jgi:outer membrane receptor for ferric coprogen and ferric-rhodotorulic acid
MNSPHASSSKILSLVCITFACAATSLLAQSTPTDSKSTPTAPTDEETTTLSPFIVKGQDDGSYSGRQTLIGSRTAKNIIDIPSNVTIISKQLLDDLNVTQLSDAMRYGVSGVTQNGNHSSDDFNIRGFRVESDMRDGVLQVMNRTNPMFDVERVEIIKGPANMLLGNSTQIGGAVNIVPYLPTGEKKTTIETTFATDNYIRAAINNSGPLVTSPDTKINYRLTLGSRTGGTEKDAERARQLFVGGALVFNFGPRQLLQVNTFYCEDDSYYYYYDFLDINSPLTDPAFNKYSTRHFSAVQAKNTAAHAGETFFSAQYVAQLTADGNNNLRLFYSYGQQRDRRRIMVPLFIAADNHTLSRLDLPFASKRVNHSLQIDYTNHLSASVFTFDTTIGADITPQIFAEQWQSANTLQDLDVSNPNWAADNVYYSQPVSGAGLPWQTDTAQKISSYNYYIQENLGLFKDRLILVGGVRENPASVSSTTDKIANKVTSPSGAKDILTHKYGVVFKLLPTVSVYYTDAANVYPQLGFADLDNPNDQKGPAAGDQEGKLKEFGLKFDHKLTENVSVFGTIAHFDMALTNVKTSGILRSGKQGNIYSAQDTSKGVEIDIGGQFKLGFGRLDMLMTYFDGTSSSTAAAGAQAYDFVPRKYSILAKITLNTGPLEGWTLGGAVMDQSAKRDGMYYVDYPLTASVFVGYHYGAHWDFRLNVDNVTNKRYFVTVQLSGLAVGSDPITPKLTAKYTW